MKGFFNTKDLEITEHEPKLAGCGACGLKAKCKHPKIPMGGKGAEGILIVGERPTDKDDEANGHFSGGMGRQLRRKLEAEGVDLDEDCWFTNAIICTTKDRAPTPLEINCCLPNLKQVIKECQPHMIWMMGDAALKAVLGLVVGQQDMNAMKWQGLVIPDRSLDAWLCPMFYPTFKKQNGTDGVREVIFDQQLHHAASYIDCDLPETKNEADQVELLSGKEAIKYMDELVSGDIAFDYETTGLKPHAPGHRIVSVAISEGDEGRTVAFMYKKALRDSLVDLLRDKHVGKRAANIMFEENWSREILNTSVRNWVWDTMQAAHILDNRQGITGLKFQSYAQFGVVDYASHITPYLKGVEEKNANSFNRIDEVDEEELLIYNGLDALFEYRLAEKQMKELEDE